MNQKRREIKKDYSIVGEQSIQPLISAESDKEIYIPISFEDWWLQVQSKYGFRPELQTSVKKHFESRGFTESRDYIAGLRDFGFRVS